MEFRSSYEQSLEVLSHIKSELISRGGKYHTLYQCLIEDDTTEYRMEPALQKSIGACMSSLLGQYQTSLFLGMWNCALRFSQTTHSCALTSNRLQRAVEVYPPGDAHSNNGQGESKPQI